MKQASMRYFHLLPFACIAALAGCGGGKKAAPEPSTGVLEGKILGVHFQTATQSGVTDGNGTFTYFPGETVAFSIGAVELGAVPGAARVSLFTLAGMTAPATELALRRDLDRATRLPTQLTRAMNIARLLIALDADSNPDNGIDLAGRTFELTDKSIDLGLGLYSFSARLDRMAPNLTRNIPMSRALVYLYQSANVMVPAHAPTRYDYTFGPGLTLSTAVTYHANGAISEESTEPGPPLVFGGASHITHTYDALGRPLTLVSESLDNLFQSSSAFRYSHAYDARGNQIGTISERELTPGGLMSRTTFSGTADADGHILASTTTEDSNGDGTIDARNTSTETFDEHGNSIAGTFSADANADGVADSSYRFTRTFDSNDRLHTETYEGDTNGDGAVDERSVTTDEEEAPRTIVRMVLIDSDADGKIDARDFTRWTYDAAGDNVLVKIYSDLGTEGTNNSGAEFRMTYDTEHRLLSRVATNDYEDDGIPEQTDVSTYVYDQIGNLLSVTLDSDAASPFGAAHQKVDYEYGANGERTAFSSRLDFDGDGVFESSSTTTFTQQAFSDGVGYIAHQYFEGSLSYVDGQPIIGGVALFTAATGNPAAVRIARSRLRP